MSRLRAGVTLAGFLALTLPLMPLQALFKRAAPGLARRFPHWYHRQVLRVLGVRLHVEGSLEIGRPVLLVSNHTSWLDIPVLSALAPVSFIAKREVSRWPLVAQLARLQRTVFVDRERRSASGAVVAQIADRLQAGDTIVLFAEGTSSDGNRVLAFRSALFGAVLAKAAGSRVESPRDSGTTVQTVALVYTHLHGLPLGRADRPRIGWYGDMEMVGHAWALLKAGPIDVSLRLGTALPLDSFKDRKALARHTEAEIRGNVVALLRGKAV